MNFFTKVFATREIARNISILAFIALIDLFVASSDLTTYGKAKVFAATTIIGVLLLTRFASRHMKPPTDLESPDQPVVNHDIGKTEGDLPDRDSPTFIRRRRAVAPQHDPFFERVRPTKS